MAEFQEVMKQFDRMCQNYQHKRRCPMSCPMSGVNISQCRKIVFDDPRGAEQTVMAWAAENPKPVYPSWMEYLMDAQPDCVEAYNSGNDTLWKWMWTTHIPADIAQKLGLEPKEGE